MPNSVSADEIVSNGVGGSEIASNAIEGDEIANDAVPGSELADGSVTSGELGGLAVRTSTPVNVPGGPVAEDGKYETEDATASCSPGEVAVGGGVVWSSDNDDEELVTVYQQYVIGVNGRPTGVKVRGGNDLGPGPDRTLTVQALCLAA